MRIMQPAVGAFVLLSACGALMAQDKPAYLKTSVNPGRAGVFVDGKYVGPAGNFGIARTYPVTPGKHEVKLVDPRFEDHTATVDVVPGKTTKLEHTMKALPEPKGPFGAMRTAVPDKYAAVYVNDHYYGHAGEFNNPTQKLLLPVGEYDVRVEPPSGAPIKQHVKLEEGKTVIVK